METQFINKRMKRFTVSVTGTVSAIVTGSSTCVRWRIKANAGNTGEIRLSTNSAGTDYFVLDKGDDTDWTPGNLKDYWYHGDTAADEFYLWELE